MGYGDDLQALKTLRFNARTIGRDRVVAWEIARPRWVRKDWDRGAVLVFDGQRAAFLAGPRGDDGELQGPHLVAESDWHHFEMDIALYVPAYFDYPAEYHGVVQLDSGPAHHIAVALPMGGTAEYLVDAESYLPVKISLPDWEFEIVPNDWTEIDGVMVYRCARCPSHPDHDTKLEQIEVNPPLASSRFTIPPTITAAE